MCQTIVNGMFILVGAFIGAGISIFVCFKTINFNRKSKEWDLFWHICDMINNVNKEIDNYGSSVLVYLKDKKIFLYEQAKEHIDNNFIKEKSFMIFLHDDFMKMLADEYFCNKAGIEKPKLNFEQMKKNNFQNKTDISKSEKFGILLSDFIKINSKNP